MEFILDIKAFIIETFLFGENKQLDDQTSFLESGIIDSTGILELLAFIENKYCVNIKDEEILPENFDNLECINNYLKTKFKDAK